MPPRSGDMSHAQLLDQLSLRIGELVVHIDKRMDTQDRRIERIDEKLDGHGETLTELSVAVAKLQATETAMASEGRPWAGVPPWKRWSIYIGAGAASVAILGGLSAAWREIVIIAVAVNAALTAPSHP